QIERKQIRSASALRVIRRYGWNLVGYARVSGRAPGNLTQDFLHVSIVKLILRKHRAGVCRTSGNRVHVKPIMRTGFRSRPKSHENYYRGQRRARVNLHRLITEQTRTEPSELSSRKLNSDRRGDQDCRKNGDDVARKLAPDEHECQTPDSEPKQQEVPAITDLTPKQQQQSADKRYQRKHGQFGSNQCEEKIPGFATHPISEPVRIKLSEEFITVVAHHLVAAEPQHCPPGARQQNRWIANQESHAHYQEELDEPLLADDPIRHGDFLKNVV